MSKTDFTNIKELLCIGKIDVPEFLRITEKMIEQLQDELKAKNEEMERLRRALKKEGYDTNPMQSGPDIRD